MALENVVSVVSVIGAAVASLASLLSFAMRGLHNRESLTRKQTWEKLQGRFEQISNSGRKEIQENMKSYEVILKLNKIIDEIEDLEESLPSKEKLNSDLQRVNSSLKRLNETANNQIILEVVPAESHKTTDF